MSDSQSEPRFARKDWIAATKFQSERSEQILALVESEVSKDGGVVTFDLDGTLLSNCVRTRVILREWLASGVRVPEEIATKLGALDADASFYSVKDAFVTAGIAADAYGEYVKLAADFWWPRFFADEYLGFDEPYVGSATAVQRILEAGAKVVYLSGRDEPRMGKGTRKSLEMHGFPVSGPNVDYRLKPDPNGDDRAHKLEAISRLENVRASFENEPMDLVQLSRGNRGKLVFVETACSELAAPALTGVYRLVRWG